VTEQQLHEGCAVCDLSGALIGTLRAYDVRSNCVVVRGCALSDADLYIPLGDTRGNDAAGNLHLRLAAVDLASERYAHPL
jgi:hypothetical protein